MESGLLLTERYRLVERLDGGGTMEVWRALDELLDRPVAVKLLAPPRAGLPHGPRQDEFQRGVNRAAGLSHPALETVFDSDRTRDASGRLTSYLVTEFLDGTTLADRLRRGPLTAGETAGVCGRIAAALGAAHAAGVTHGDLRPGKIMLLRDGVKLVDTGIGGLVRGGRAPDAADGEAADVRALGAVIAACAAPEASGGPAAIAARCLAEEPPSARRIAALLARDDAPPRRALAAPARRTGTPHPPPHRHGPRPVRLAALALAVAVTAAAAAILASPSRTPAAVPPPARTGAAPAPAAPADGAPAAEPAGTRVRGALGRLRPIVSRGYASGEIRSDVAADLDNVISNLEDDLTADRDVDVGRRIALLLEKIATRLRERALTPGLADELTRVLAAVRA
ncbi:hypothetical protein [Actinomadura sp. GTD37]|uniref:protein kinase domain-containing protein n=1 Tax=Actinomadura sp. GTD37 TaxID=1778030 RepID=UPI0035BFDFA0